MLRKKSLFGLSLTNKRAYQMIELLKVAIRKAEFLVQYLY